jgi:hypothetical protein
MYGEGRKATLPRGRVAALGDYLAMLQRGPSVHLTE